MGAFLDPANEFVAGGIEVEQFKNELIDNIQRASKDQMEQLAHILIKDISAK